MCRSLPSVERVVHELPQLHVTVMFLYSGWILAFMAMSLRAAGTPLQTGKPRIIDHSARRGNPARDCGRAKGTSRFKYLLPLTADR